MLPQFKSLLFPATILILSVLNLNGQSLEVTENLTKQVKKVSEKRYERSTWLGGSQRSSLQSKRFAMKNYDKHFSSLGRKRAAIDLKEKREKKRFRAPDVQVYEKRAVEFSDWNEKMAKLQQQARISTDVSAQSVLDRKRYQMILQDTPKAYADLAEELSMRDVNRFAFRRNRSKERVGQQAEQAGSDSK